MYMCVGFVEEKPHDNCVCILDIVFPLYLIVIFSLFRFRQRFIAGIYLIGSGTTIRSGTKYSLVDSACRFSGPKKIFPFAFRTHAHHLGTLSAKF